MVPAHVSNAPMSDFLPIYVGLQSALLEVPSMGYTGQLGTASYLAFRIS